MEATAIFIAISVSVLVAFCLPLFMSGGRAKAAENKARAVRLADAKMNARLLRLSL